MMRVISKLFLRCPGCGYSKEVQGVEALAYESRDCPACTKGRPSSWESAKVNFQTETEKTL